MLALVVLPPLDAALSQQDSSGLRELGMRWRVPWPFLPWATVLATGGLPVMVSARRTETVPDPGAPFWQAEKERLKRDFPQQDIWIMQYEGRLI